MTIISEWMAAWNIPQAAIDDLQRRLTVEVAPSRSGRSELESDAQARTRLEASKAGVMLLRNNVGAGMLDNGRFMRWGLANDSTAVNRRIKSGDLIGIRKRVITPADVGHVMGQFTSREMKRPGWGYHPNDEHERAQMRWAILVATMGGDSGFSTGGWPK